VGRSVLKKQEGLVIFSLGSSGWGTDITGIGNMDDGRGTARLKINGYVRVLARKGLRRGQKDD